MSSWFSSESFQSLKANATSLAGNAAELAGKVVQDSGILQNMEHSEMMQKLTLTTPELSAERARIDAEERRKEMVHDKLAGMLPWETRDAERDILVDECKEAILKLSSDATTFTGPWKMPEKSVHYLNKKRTKKTKSKSSNEQQDDSGGGEDEDDDEEDDDETEETPESPTTTSGGQQHLPSAASLEKLEKLQPLPPLLQDFDLDMHVGLIQRLLQEDAELVKMQSTLSGGGAREQVFWHNYFFHCAYTRYEAGLSIDEIWSDDNQALPAVVAVAADGGGAAATYDGTGATSTTQNADNEEDTITFEDADESGANSVGATTAVATVAATPVKGEAGMDPTMPTTTDSGGGGKESSENRDSSDYEIVGNADGNDASNNNDKNCGMGGDSADDDDVDYELDELEEEIARELED